MRYPTGVATLGLLLVSGCAPRADLGPEMHVLGKLQDVGAVAVYASGERHEFHELAHAILYEGSEADFVRLTRDPRPVPRCMGLYLLARSGSPRAATILERHIPDQKVVSVQIGCVGVYMTVGGFARRLLRNRDYLEFWSEPSPVWPPFEILADDLRLLAYDGAPPSAAAEAAWAEVRPFNDRVMDSHLVAPADEDRVGLEPGKSIRTQLDKGAASLDEKTFARLCRRLPRWRVVKAIGRAGPHPAVRLFLLDRLTDPREEGRTRLVAASALTRDPAPESLAALRAHADDVDAWSGVPGTAADFARQAERRAELDAQLRRVAAHRAWEEVETINPSASEREAAGMPARTFEAIEQSGDPVLLEWHGRVASAFEDDCNEADGRELGWKLRASAKLREHRAAWDTYSDAVHLLARGELSYFVGSNGEDDDSGGGLFGGGSLFDVEEEQDPDQALLEANIREALRGLDREPR